MEFAFIRNNSTLLSSSIDKVDPLITLTIVDRVVDGYVPILIYREGPVMDKEIKKLSDITQKGKIVYGDWVVEQIVEEGMNIPFNSIELTSDDFEFLSGEQKQEGSVFSSDILLQGTDPGQSDPLITFMAFISEELPSEVLNAERVSFTFKTSLDGMGEDSNINYVFSGLSKTPFLNLPGFGEPEDGLTFLYAYGEELIFRRLLPEPEDSSDFDDPIYSVHYPNASDRLADLEISLLIDNNASNPSFQVWVDGEYVETFGLDSPIDFKHIGIGPYVGWSHTEPKAVTYEIVNREFEGYLPINISDTLVTDWDVVPHDPQNRMYSVSIDEPTYNEDMDTIIEAGDIVLFDKEGKPSKVLIDEDTSTIKGDWIVAPLDTTVYKQYQFREPRAFPDSSYSPGYLSEDGDTLYINQRADSITPMRNNMSLNPGDSYYFQLKFDHSSFSYNKEAEIIFRTDNNLNINPHLFRLSLVSTGQDEGYRILYKHNGSDQIEDLQLLTDFNNPLLFVVTEITSSGFGVLDIWEVGKNEDVLISKIELDVPNNVEEEYSLGVIWGTNYGEEQTSGTPIAITTIRTPIKPDTLIELPGNTSYNLLQERVDNEDFIDPANVEEFYQMKEDIIEGEEIFDVKDPSRYNWRPDQLEVECYEGIIILKTTPLEELVSTGKTLAFYMTMTDTPNRDQSRFYSMLSGSFLEFEGIPTDPYRTYDNFTANSIQGSYPAYGSFTSYKSDPPVYVEDLPFKGKGEFWMVVTYTPETKTVNTYVSGYDNNPINTYVLDEHPKYAGFGGEAVWDGDSSQSIPPEEFCTISFKTIEEFEDRGWINILEGGGVKTQIKVDERDLPKNSRNNLFRVKSSGPLLLQSLNKEVEDGSLVFFGSNGKPIRVLDDEEGRPDIPEVDLEGYVKSDRNETITGEWNRVYVNSDDGRAMGSVEMEALLSDNPADEYIERILNYVGRDVDFNNLSTQQHFNMSKGGATNFKYVRNTHTGTDLTCGDYGLYEKMWTGVVNAAYSPMKISWRRSDDAPEAQPFINSLHSGDEWKSGGTYHQPTHYVLTGLNTLASPYSDGGPYGSYYSKLNYWLSLPDRDPTIIECGIEIATNPSTVQYGHKARWNFGNVDAVVVKNDYEVVADNQLVDKRYVDSRIANVVTTDDGSSDLIILSTRETIFVRTSSTPISAKTLRIGGMPLLGDWVVINPLDSATWTNETEEDTAAITIKSDSGAPVNGVAEWVIPKDYPMSSIKLIYVDYQVGWRITS